MEGMYQKFRIPKKARRRLLAGFFVALCGFLGLLYWQRVLSVVVVLGLILLGIVSLFWKRYVRLSLGFEMITFATVLLAYSLNPLLAILAGIIMVVIGNYLAGRICMPIFAQIIAYTAVAIFASVLPYDIASTGKICTIIFNLVLHAMYILLFRFRIENSVLSFILNTVINFFLFGNFSMLFYSMLYV